MNRIEHKKKRLLKALESSLGIVSIACTQTRISRTSFYEYLKSDPVFSDKVAAISDIALDFVESKLFKQIEELNTSATIFYLKTKGKNRGYIERQEISGPNGAPIELSTKANYDNLSIDELRELQRIAEKLEGQGD